MPALGCLILLATLGACQSPDENSSQCRRGPSPGSQRGEGGHGGFGGMRGAGMGGGMMGGRFGGFGRVHQDSGADRCQPRPGDGPDGQSSAGQGGRSGRQDTITPSGIHIGDPR
ncbi:hypothetical protein AA13595_0907 [Gluconacetobacter johannae DSM 13595]|nr:hypothetical protein AA13595_0907 [Gluconacetobacter johannae DSM 13595]